MSCESGGYYELRIKLDIQKVNGTLIHVLQPEYIKCPTDPWLIVATFFLSLIFLISFALNCLVVITIATSYTLKKYQHCHLIVNLCAVCMLDCLFNITVAISYVSTVPWRFGHFMCYFNSFTMNMITCQMAFAIFFLAVDRLCVAKKYAPYMGISKLKMNILVVGTWIASFLLASPTVFGFIASMPYRMRYSCAIADPKDDYYLITHLVMVIIVPTPLILLFLLETSCTFHREKKKQRKVKGSQTYSYFDQILMTPYYRNEFYPALFVGFAIIAYTIFWLPFSVLSIVDPMLTQHWNNETTDSFSGHKKIRNWVQISDVGLPGGNAVIDDSIYSNMTTNSTTKKELMPEIDATPSYETAFIWLRFLYDLLIPIFIYAIMRELRNKSEGLMSCCRPNSVDVASPKPVAPPYLNKMGFRGTSDTNDKNNKKQKNKNMVNFRTPVLFATSEGLHIRTVDETYLEILDNKPLLGFAKNPNIDPEFTYDLCDVTLGYEDLTDFDGPFHIDDQYDYSKKREMIDDYTNSIVGGANRAAVEMRQGIKVDMKNDIINVTESYYSPAPPKNNFSSPKYDIFDDTIELEDDRKKNNKGKKSVRFNSALNQEISRPNTVESSILDSSVGSSFSNDSGILADNEIVQNSNSPTGQIIGRKTRKKSKIPQTRARNKARSEKKPSNVVHNVRKQKSSKGPNSSPKQNKGSSGNSRFSIGNSNKNNKNKNGVSKPRNIKSRHIGNVKMLQDENDFSDS